MSHRVFITGVEYKIPGLEQGQSLNDFIYSNPTPAYMEEKHTSKDHKIELGHLNIDPETEGYPQKGDLKIMREDVLALTVALQSLVKDLQLTPHELNHTPLFIATGCTVDHLSKESERMNKVYGEVKGILDKAERNKKIAKAIPPLLGLRTLTNGAQSFASQYTQVTGPGTTFGVTSIGGFYALKEGIEMIKAGESDKVIIGTSNLCGLHSFLTYKNFVEGSETWRESSAAVCISLESEKSIAKRKATPLIEITDNKQFPSVPSLFNKERETPKIEADSLLFSGAFTSHDYQKDINEFTHQKHFSWYPLLGNLGASALLLNVAFAYENLQRKPEKSYSCYDYDPYGRNSLVNLQKI